MGIDDNEFTDIRYFQLVGVVSFSMRGSEYWKEYVSTGERRDPCSEEPYQPC